MNINLNKTMVSIEKLLTTDRPGLAELKGAYQYTLRLQSQLIAAIYDVETFGGQSVGKRLVQELSAGTCCGSEVVLAIWEPLPSMKRLSEAVEEHWKGMLHAAIREAAEQRTLPYFERAFVEIEITTPRGSNNARLWDTSNREINNIINNLKGIFFEDDNMEHMAFSVVGRWGEKGVTIIRISQFDESRQIRGIRLERENG